ncbi:MAG: ribosylglycohydrolase [Frankia sp.]
MGAQVEAALAEASSGVGGTFGSTPPGADLPRAGAATIRRVPTGFALAEIVTSNGWAGLPPASYEPGAGVLHRTLTPPEAGPLTVSVRQVRGVVVASWGRTTGTPGDRAAIAATIGHMLSVDDDLSDLYDACDAVPGFEWVRRSGRGRLLRSPTVWEDAVRTLATTNTSWSRTRALLDRLVDGLGPTGPAGERAFPDAAAVAAAGVGFLRDVVRAGYRAEPLERFAASVASGRIDVESWLDRERPDDQVRAEISALAGFGPFATDGLMALLGRPRGLTLDAWAARQVGELCGQPGPADEAAAAARYRPFGRWAGTVCWLEITRREPAPTVPTQGEPTEGD